MRAARPDGRVDAATLCAASIAGVDEVYRVGGAQAIAAMAYGTPTLPAVDVIAGPGNAYVAEAKRQLSGVVGVASAFAGPSEIVVVAGPDAPAAFAAIDLVVQAEHGPDGLAWLVTWDADLAEEISAEVDRIVAASSRRADLEATLAAAGIVCLVDGPEQALAVANAVAPEHLQLMVPEEEGLALLGLVQNAGAVFIGVWSPASMGDYIAGPNHVLPTNRTARFASALRADDFRKHLHAVRVTPDALRTLGPLAVTLAETEGLPAHADSVRRRLDALDGAGSCALSAVPPVRPDLQLSEGYHSPQVEAEVRLNTNESPFAPPDAWREEVLAALARSRSTATPTDPPPSCARPSPTCTASHRPRCSAPTARTRSCSACSWPSGDRAAAPWSSSRRTRCTRTSRGSPGPRSSRARATTTSRSTPVTPATCWRASAPTSRSCARPTTRPVGRSRPPRWPSSARPRPAS